MPKRRVEELARSQLDNRLNRARKVAPTLRPPRGGWIATLRKALGMTQAQVASRVGRSPQAISQLEQREVEGSATLKALEQAAQALGGRLVYVIIPDRPVGEIRRERAVELAREMLGSVRHSMRLEDQEPKGDLEERTQELAEELLSSSAQLWSRLDDG